MHKFFFIIGLLFCFLGFSQTDLDFKRIDSLGRSYTARLKSGNLEQFKNNTPAEGTWTYKRLLEYREDLNESSIDIVFGDFIGPSVTENLYAYNLFAYRILEGDEREYYFAAIISVDISDDYPKVENAYLFTEKEALKSWWSHVFGLYYSKTIEKIPEDYRYPVCPPPPFKEE